MDLLEQLIVQGWKPYGNRFGVGNEKPLQILTNGNMMTVINCQHDSYVIPPFELPIKIDNPTMQIDNLSDEDEVQKELRTIINLASEKKITPKEFAARRDQIYNAEKLQS